MTRPNVSRTMQSYLQLLTEQLCHYATLRLFGGFEQVAHGRLCLDAQVPVLASPDGQQLCECSLVAWVSYRKDGVYHRELLRFESHYDPGEVLGLGPARWETLADTLAYQLISQLVQWKRDKEVVLFNGLPATTGLKPNRQRFYL